MPAAPGELILEIHRVLPAPPAVVFAASAMPGQPAEWSGPKGFAIPRLDFDPRTGAA
jgi:uncharacterized protein YndB with AHSA1/START domain